MNNIISVNLDNLTESERAMVLSLAEKSNAPKEVKLSDIKDGETFKIADIEFIKFPSMNGMTPIVTRDIVFNSKFGDNNDLRGSIILKKLQTEFLPKIISAVGEENLCPITTDLTTLDSLKPYKDMVSFISLPTFDFYRENVDIFDKHKVDKWWWLATPESAQPHSDPYWILCVSPSGRIFINFHYYGCGGGVRPFLALKSSIFESSED